MLAAMGVTAYRIVTERLVLRCYEPSDAPMVRDTVSANLEHLAEMPWVRHEPQTVEQKLALLRTFRGEFDLDRNHVYGVFEPNGTTLVGSTGLHPRIGEGAREIGYWIARDRINQGLATETAGALTRVGFELGGWTRIEIHCTPTNRRSARVAEKLGYRHEATLRNRDVDAAGRPRDVMIWTLFAADYPGSPAAKLPLSAYDVLGRPLL
jgi:RimJ/RimL family protein N-acetyltransferase